MRLDDIKRLVAGGESETLEFKKSTGQLNRAGESLCAFLNTNGGTVIVGVTPQRKIIGQQVSDTTGQDIAETLKKFDPPAPVEIEHVPLPDSDKKLILLYAAPQRGSRPFTFDGHPYQRIETTSSVMPQERYQQLLLGPVTG